MAPPLWPPVALSGGNAVFTTSTLSVTSHNITAIYNGDSNFGASLASNIVPQVVNLAATTVPLAGSGSPTVAGQSLTFTATVNITAPGTGTPTGTVTFEDGGTAIATVSVSGSGAVFTTSTLSVTSHNITAIYNGDSNFTRASRRTSCPRRSTRPAPRSPWPAAAARACLARA